MLNLYLISQSVNKDYDTFDSAVVAAASEEEARLIYPKDNDKRWSGSMWRWHLEDGRVVDSFGYSWTDPDCVSVQFLAAGYEGPAGTVLASFNAG
jgi:hypothetical protein